MSLMNKTMTVDFDISGTIEEAEKAIANGIYTIIKDIYTDSSIEENTVYLDKDKQYNIQITNSGGSNKYFQIHFNNQNNYLESNYQANQILKETNKLITYTVSKEKTIIAFGIGSDKLDLAIGYQEEIGYFFLKIGNLGSNSVSATTSILLKNTMVQKHQSTAYNSTTSISYNRWLSQDAFLNKTFVNLPLFVQSGTFSELYELESCYGKENINYNNIIYSNGKYYKLLTLSSIENNSYYPAKANTTILAIEVAND